MLDGLMNWGVIPAGSGAWKVHGVPWTWRQVLQWQMCVLRGRDVVGGVIVNCMLLQWHFAVRVLVLGDVMLGVERKDGCCVRRGGKARIYTSPARTLS
jgi:hypothetical protein